MSGKKFATVADPWRFYHGSIRANLGAGLLKSPDRPAAGLASAGPQAADGILDRRIEHLRKTCFFHLSHFSGPAAAKIALASFGGRAPGTVHTG